MDEFHGVFPLFFGLAVEELGQLDQAHFFKVNGNGDVLMGSGKLALNLVVEGGE
jgi:hypothetical protein